MAAWQGYYALFALMPKSPLIGPSVPLLSKPLAQAGITLLGGARVVEPQTCLDLLAEGASGYHLFERSIARVNLRIRNSD